MNCHQMASAQSSTWVAGAWSSMWLADDYFVWSFVMTLKTVEPNIDSQVMQKEKETETLQKLLQDYNEILLWTFK